MNDAGESLPAPVFPIANVADPFVVELSRPVKVIRDIGRQGPTVRGGEMVSR